MVWESDGDIHDICSKCIDRESDWDIHYYMIPCAVIKKVAGVYRIQAITEWYKVGNATACWVCMIQAMCRMMHWLGR